jgi:malate dehydrogenase (oxaloacetate-decarboxylating)(NADP+)
MDYRLVPGPAVACPLSGAELTSNSVFNKGTAFTEAERDEFGLRGFLPPRVFTLAQQVERVMGNYRHKPDDLERHIHLIALLDRNETLFYRVVLDHLEEMLPIIYTPTVGRACVEFSRIFRRRRGLYLVPEDAGRVGRILSHWPWDDVRVIVVTDGERILGLGDLGANGMGIPIGKLSLYVAAGGFHPSQVLPICLDTGTEREELLLDPNYVGLPRRRIRGEPYDALVDELVREVRARWPKVVLQFEDFAGPNALRLLDRHRDRARCFNDDIQGTGAVALAAVLASQRITRRREERIVVAGAGGAGIGIGRALAPLGPVWMTDSRGLVVRPEPDRYKAEFAREGPRVPLEELVRSVRPTVLVGVSGHGGLFHERILSSLADRPLVLPLSNPTILSECTPEQVRRLTNGLVATGSPFPGATQCNNVYIFPGVGLGAAGDRITDAMFATAARTLASLAGEALLANGLLFPPIHEIRRVSKAVAEAIRGGPVAQWEPEYLPYVRR